jgi:hypothetical protein
MGHISSQSFNKEQYRSSDDKWKTWSIFRVAPFERN